MDLGKRGEDSWVTQSVRCQAKARALINSTWSRIGGTADAEVVEQTLGRIDDRSKNEMAINRRVPVRSVVSTLPRYRSDWPESPLSILQWRVLKKSHAALNSWRMPR
jgi:hypothetical protein